MLTDCPSGYTGQDCLECSPGYYYGSQGHCHQCLPSALALTVVLLGWPIVSFAIIFITILNVSNGFNRRTIHSIVIKIFIAFLNYITSYADGGYVPWRRNTMLLSTLGLFNIECFIKRSDTNTYSRLIVHVIGVFLFPFFLIILTSVLSAIWLRTAYHVTWKARIDRAQKLEKKLRAEDLQNEADLVRNEIASRRVVSLWRVSHDPSMTKPEKLLKFFKDMVPIYIVACVTTYTVVLRRIAMLMKCYVAEDGVTRHVLVPSVVCETFDNRYLKLILAFTLSLTMWGVGVPTLFISLLWRHRKQLALPEIRQVYGFLHNGYRVGFWWWELMFFLRKFLIQIYPIYTSQQSRPSISGPYIPPSSTSTSVIPILLSSISFVCSQLCTPFDSRNADILNHLETLSLVTWCVSSALTYFVNSSVGESILAIEVFVLIINILFALLIVVCLYKECCNWARAEPRFQSSRIMKFFARQSIRRKDREPTVRVAESSIVFEKPGGSRTEWWSRWRPRLTSGERQLQMYFTRTAIDVNKYFSPACGCISTDQILYVLRQALVARHVEQNKRANVTRLTDLPENMFQDVVQYFANRKKEAEEAKIEKAKRLEMALANYYKQREQQELPHETPGAKQYYENNEVASVLRGLNESIPVAALVDSNDEVLKGSIPVGDFYSHLYGLEQQGDTRAEAQRFWQFMTLRQLQAYGAKSELEVQVNLKKKLIASLQEALGDQQEIVVSRESQRRLESETKDFEARLLLIQKLREHTDSTTIGSTLVSISKCSDELLSEHLIGTSSGTSSQ